MSLLQYTCTHRHTEQTHTERSVLQMNKKREQTTEQKNRDFKSEATNAQNKMPRFTGNLGQARWDPVSWAVWQEAMVGVRERGRCAARWGRTGIVTQHPIPREGPSKDPAGVCQKTLRSMLPCHDWRQQHPKASCGAILRKISKWWKLRKWIAQHQWKLLSFSYMHKHESVSKTVLFKKIIKHTVWFHLHQVQKHVIKLKSCCWGTRTYTFF